LRQRSDIQSRSDRHQSYFIKDILKIKNKKLNNKNQSHARHPKRIKRQTKEIDKII